MTSEDATSIGPVEVLVVEFEGNRFTGELAPALSALVDAGTVRILDLVLVLKTADGTVVSYDLAELPDGADGAYARFEAGTSELLSEEDIAEIAAGLDPESSVGILVWENVWASRFAQAVRNAHGRVLLNERIPHEIVERALAALAPS